MSDIDRIWQERAEAAEAEIESRIEDRDYWYRVAMEAKDQRDRAEATLERVREAVKRGSLMDVTPTQMGFESVLAAQMWWQNWHMRADRAWRENILAALAPVTEEGDKE